MVQIKSVQRFVAENPVFFSSRTFRSWRTDGTAVPMSATRQKRSCTWSILTHHLERFQTWRTLSGRVKRPGFSAPRCWMPWHSRPVPKADRADPLAEVPVRVKALRGSWRRRFSAAPLFQSSSSRNASPNCRGNGRRREPPAVLTAKVSVPGGKTEAVMTRPLVLTGGPMLTLLLPGGSVAIRTSLEAIPRGRLMMRTSRTSRTMVMTSSMALGGPLLIATLTAT
mmetsp:Transcript_62869/g.136546  ORF Transcript_62869/g.136546 Transcript_62869/m.136546 type:complete len:225 (-) Transcript_62869:26-700(-)